MASTATPADAPPQAPGTGAPAAGATPTLGFTTLEQRP